jgi:integrase
VNEKNRRVTCPPSHGDAGFRVCEPPAGVNISRGAGRYTVRYSVVLAPFAGGQAALLGPWGQRSSAARPRRTPRTGRRRKIGRRSRSRLRNWSRTSGVCAGTWTGRPFRTMKTRGSPQLIITKRADYGRCTRRSVITANPPSGPGVSAGINLHLHDLRREAGSRLLDAGVPLSVIQASLDHAKISTSSRPLKVTQHGQHVALKPDEETRARDTNVAHGRRRSPTNRFQVSLSNNGI